MAAPLSPGSGWLMASVHSAISEVKGERPSGLLSKLTMATWLGAWLLVSRSDSSMVSSGVVLELGLGCAAGLDEDYEREGLGGGGLECDLLRGAVVGEDEVVGGEGVDDIIGGGLDKGGDDDKGGGGVEGWAVRILRETRCRHGCEQGGNEQGAHVWLDSGSDYSVFQPGLDLFSSFCCLSQR